MSRDGVTASAGWVAAGVAAGTKPSGDLDLALVCSDRPATVAGAFTTNKVVGAPVTVCRNRVGSGRARGVVVSAGVANVSTGRAGLSDAVQMAAAAAEVCGVPEEEMLVSSTGMIGPRLPMDRVLPGIDEAGTRLSADGWADAARAILTTDTRPKTAVRRIELGGRTVTVGGMAKGAGMIAPRMAVPQATLLVYLTTDGAADPSWLRQVVAAGIGPTFNSITIDNCMSTSDTVLLFANGASGAAVDGSEIFAGAVHEVMADLAYAVVADGEGATKVVRVQVGGAATDAEARAVAGEVANSMLVRSAVWGRDPNWGRVAQAAGQSPDAALDPRKLRIGFGGVDLAVDGVDTGRAAEAAESLVGQEVVIAVDLGLGSGRAEVLTCDLTPDYIRFNADYTT